MTELTHFIEHARFVSIKSLKTIEI